MNPPGSPIQQSAPSVLVTSEASNTMDVEGVVNALILGTGGVGLSDGNGNTVSRTREQQRKSWAQGPRQRVKDSEDWCHKDLDRGLKRDWPVQR